MKSAPDYNQPVGLPKDNIVSCILCIHFTEPLAGDRTRRIGILQSCGVWLLLRGA